MSSYAQENVAEVFIDDMLILAGNFAQPAADGVGYQNSAGWFSSAAALEKWDFRFSVQGNALFVPSDRKKYSLRQDQLGLLQIKGANSAELPTAFGGTSDVTFVANEGILSFEFDAFQGVDRDFVPNAFAQLAVGLPYETELTVRATPELTIDGVTSSTIGVGLKHGLSQYFRTYKDEDDFQIALAGAYSKFNVEYGFNPIGERNLLLMDLISVDANLFMAEVIGSKKWNYFEPFATLGFINSKFNYELGGSGAFLPQVNSEIEELADAETSVKADLGFNLHYRAFRFTTMATLGEFFNANVGLYVRI